MEGKALRRVMRVFPQGVTVVTTPGQEPRGITVSAFMSVSLAPPIVLVMIQKSARAHEAIEQAGAYAVNLLAQDQGALSDHFATQGLTSEEQFASVLWTPAQSGAPILAGALGYLDCRVVETTPHGDHTFFFGEVLSGDVTSEAGPLVFFARGYWGLGPQVHQRD